MAKVKEDIADKEVALSYNQQKQLITDLNNQIEKLKRDLDQEKAAKLQAEADLKRNQEDYNGSLPGQQLFNEAILEVLWSAGYNMKPCPTKKKMMDFMEICRDKVGRARAEQLERYWRS